MQYNLRLHRQIFRQQRKIGRFVVGATAIILAVIALGILVFDPDHPTRAVDGEQRTLTALSVLPANRD